MRWTRRESRSEPPTCLRRCPRLRSRALDEARRDAVLGRMPGGLPRIEAAEQRPHPRVAAPQEDLRGAPGGRLVRAMAIHDDVAIGGEVVGLRDHVEVEERGAGNVWTRLLGEARSDIDDERTQLGIERGAQLVDADD